MQQLALRFGADQPSASLLLTSLTGTAETPSADFDAFGANNSTASLFAVLTNSGCAATAPPASRLDLSWSLVRAQDLPAIAESAA